MNGFTMSEHIDGKIVVIFAFDGRDADEWRELQGLLGVAQTLAKGRVADRIEATISSARVREIRERERAADDEGPTSPTMGDGSNRVQISSKEGPDEKGEVER